LTWGNLKTLARTCN